MAAPTTKDIYAHKVLTAQAFDGSWTERENMMALVTSFGTTKAVGRGSFELVYGDYGKAGTIDTYAIPAIAGHYIKVEYDGDDVWWGVLGPNQVRPGGPDSNHGVIGYQAEHILGILDRQFPCRGLEVSDGHVAHTGPLLPFNVLPGGDMDTADDVTNGCRLHHRDGTGTYWTAYHVIRTLLTLFANRFVDPYTGHATGITWELTSSANLTWQVPPFNPNGKSILEIINLLCSQDRGVVIRVSSVDAVTDTVYLTAYNCARRSVTIGSSSWSAATPENVNFDTDAEEWKDPEIHVAPRPYDAVYAYGARPWVGLSLWYQQGNSASSIVPDGWTYSDTPSECQGSEDVWHRFKIADDWDGRQYNKSGLTVGIRSNLETAGILPTGYASWTADIPAPSQLELTANVPASIGWGTSESGPRQGGVVVISDNAGKWRLFPISIRCGHGFIHLGTDRRSAAMLKAMLASGDNTMVVTVGAREWCPITVATCQATPVRDVHTVLTREVPSAELWEMIDGTVKGINTSGALVTYSADDTIRDDVPELQKLVAMNAAHITEGGGAIRFTLDGEIKVPTTTWFPPGKLIATATATGIGFTPYAVVQTVIWNWTSANFGTTWEAIPRRPGSRRR